MHYEKKWLYKTSRRQLLWSFVIITATLIVALLLTYLHTPLDFWWPVKFTDIINMVAQLATAAAFFLAIHQYRKNSESKRQDILVDESRTIIEKMKYTAKNFMDSEDPSRQEAIMFLSVMTSHAGNFDAIFLATNEGIHKAIVRMHWQDMYFMEFNNAIQHFNKKITLTKFGISHVEHLQNFARLRSATKIGNPLPIFSEYINFQYIFNQEQIKSKITIKNDDRFIMHSFEKTLLNNKALNDHLYGCMNFIDIRVRCPMMAVINEQYDIQHQTRNPNEYRAFFADPT